MLGIPYQISAKYLGIILDDDLSFRSETQALKQLLDNLWRQLYAAGQYLPGQIYFVWKTLVESKFMQRLCTIAHFSQKAHQAAKTVYYVAIKRMFNIKKNLNKHRVLSTTLDDIDVYLDYKYRLAIAPANVKDGSAPGGNEEYTLQRTTIRNINVTLKTLLIHNIKNLLSYKLGALTEPRRKIKGFFTTTKCKCNQTSLLTQDHIMNCRLLPQAVAAAELRIFRSWPELLEFTQ